MAARNTLTSPSDGCLERNEQSSHLCKSVVTTNIYAHFMYAVCYTVIFH